MKGEIIEMTKAVTEQGYHFWQITINVQEEPDLKMGKCEIKNADEKK